MMLPPASCFVGRLRRSPLWSTLLIGGVLLSASLMRPGRALAQRDVPTLSYQAAFYDFYEGEYKDALERFRDEFRGAIRTTQTRWIDSICYHTMIGECYYHMGQLPDALDHYTAAIRLYLSFSDWMIRVQFPHAIRPVREQPTPWGVSARRAQLGQYPRTMSIRQGHININEQIQRGGAIQAPVLIPIQVEEIVRCTTLAIRRRTELMGPLCKHDLVTSQLVEQLSRRPGPPNHWSQAWIDVELGVALIAAGKEDEAVARLNRAIVAAGQFDHPLTSTALFELGRLALLQGNYPVASQLFHEASIAAFHYFDGGILEESLRYGAITHLAANNPGVFPPLAPAIQLAKVKDLRQLQVSLLLSMAENLAVLGRTAEAGATLEEARIAIGRRRMGVGRIGARLSYLGATVLFQERQIDAGNEALAAAMAYMQRGSHWLYHIAQLDRLFRSGQVTIASNVTPREAMKLYEELLGDPRPADWSLQPMESLAVLVTPHSAAVEHWFLLALNQKAHEAALEIADRVRRHRFFSSLAFGGRLQSLRWILEAPEEALSQQALLDRQDLLAQYPAYEELSQEARRIRTALEAMPLVIEAPDAARQQREGLGLLAAISLHQEAVLREMAVRREKAELVFPPLRSTKEIREALPDGQVMLVFLAAAGDLYGFLVDKTEYSYWRVKGAAALTRDLVTMLREMGHYEQNHALSLEDLGDPEWKQSAQAALEKLLDGSQADFTADFPEIVIVPDGILWYVPFEALQVEIDGQLRPLIERFRIRYAPTASLAVPGADIRGWGPTSRTAVVLGRIYPRDDESVAQAAYEGLAKVVPRSVALSRSPLPAPSSIYGALMQQLIVLDDIYPPELGPYSWAPIQIDRGKPGNTLNDWLALPWGGPGVIILPGYHTAAENSLKQVNRGAGSEIFLSVCGLMANGARTVLLSRWRTGGQSSVELVREFTQELPHTTPADAWQRAVLLAAATRLDLDAEPRIKSTPNANPPKGSHPFFWSGFMLIDSGTVPVPADVAAGEREPEVPVLKIEKAKPKEQKVEPKEQEAEPKEQEGRPQKQEAKPKEQQAEAEEQKARLRAQGPEEPKNPDEGEPQKP